MPSQKGRYTKRCDVGIHWSDWIFLLSVKKKMKSIMRTAIFINAFTITARVIAVMFLLFCFVLS